MTNVIHVKDLQEALGDMGLSVEEAIAEYGYPEDTMIISEGESLEFTNELADNGVNVFNEIMAEEDYHVDVPVNAPYTYALGDVTSTEGNVEYTDVPLAADINMIELPTIQYEEYIDVPMF